MTTDGEQQRRAVLAELQLGEVRRGTVSAIMNFGVFVDIGGLDGLVTVANLTWRRFADFTEVVHVGQAVTVVVLDIDRDRERVALSMKDLEPDPLLAFARTRLGDDIAGVVDAVIPPGLVVRLEEGVYGLLPADDPGLAREDADGHAYAQGDAIDVQAYAINLQKRRVWLRVTSPAR